MSSFVNDLPIPLEVEDFETGRKQLFRELPVKAMAQILSHKHKSPAHGQESMLQAVLPRTVG